MNNSLRLNLGRGTLSTRNVAIVVPIVALLAAAAYLTISSAQFSSPNASSRYTISTSLTSTQIVTVTNGQIRGLLNLFGNFSHLEISSSFLDEMNEDAGNASFSYVLLGRRVLNSTNYYRVEFQTPGTNTSEIVWFNPQGGIDRVDIPGEKSYTGPGAAFYTELFTNPFSALAALSNNATLLSGLLAKGISIETIGQTQIDVTTYGLAQPTSTYSNFTIKVATLPGTNVKLVIYLYQENRNGSYDLLRVVGLTNV